MLTLLAETARHMLGRPLTMMPDPVPSHGPAVTTPKSAVDNAVDKLGDTSPKVVILYKSLPQYRKAFFDRLRLRLAASGIRLELIYGQPVQKEQAKQDTVDLPWAHKVENVHLSLLGRTLIWQPVLGHLRGANLVIVEQASKLLINHLLWATRRLWGFKFALWGHGRNFQGHTAHPLGEGVKKFTSRSVDWWFSYNELSTDVITQDIGFPKSKVTTVQNAIDTKALIYSLDKLTPRDIETVRAKLGIESQNVAIFAGGMYREKRLGFLLKACHLIKKQVPDFEMIFIGSGEDKAIVEQAAAEFAWIHYLGPKFGGEKVLYFALAKLMLIPGLVGLGVLDSFSLGVPLVTTNVDYHSPEIDYLVDGENGRIVQEAEDAGAYAEEVVTLLGDDALRKGLVSNCVKSSQIYTLEAMVERFASGVEAALKI